MISEPLSWANSGQYFFAHIIGMPNWHKAVVLIAAIVCGSGTFSSIMSRSNATSPGMTVATTEPMDTGSTAGNSFMSRVSPHMIKVGASVVIGFVVGWYIRAFIKTMVIFGLIVIGCVWLANHFGVFQVSPGEVQRIHDKSLAATHWMEVHAEGWKDWLTAKLPSAGGGSFGAWLGFKRR
jgi:uncharacterized membrane protein (Fun14 family)